MSDDKPAAAAGHGVPVPQWVYVLGLLLGVPLAGGGGSLLGASQAATDLARLEQKVDNLDRQLDRLTLAIARAHPEIDVLP
jgi:hypothetical protein